jgi:hypothetical protein
MTRDEVLRRLWTTRAEFDRLVSEIPVERLSEPCSGCAHAPKDVIWHVAAYDELIVSRIRAARDGDTTAFDRDRVGWEAFNERIWAEARDHNAISAVSHAEETFLDLLEEVGQLSDEELFGTGGIVAAIDPAWLQGRTLAEVIAVDGHDHYPMHYSHLQDAARD